MALHFVSRHLSVRRRAAQRRIRQVLARTSAPHAALFGPATAAFGAASVASHVVMTWGLLMLSQPALPDEAHDPLVATRFLYPLMRKSPQPTQERISYIGLGGPVVESAPGSVKQGTSIGTAPQTPATVASQGAVDADPPEVYTELEVDIAAERDPESEGPSYPEDLLDRKIEGAVRVRFVIDSTGHADETTFAVLEASEAGFIEAVRLALPRMRFRPAHMGPRRVPQRVEQSFEFRITPPVLVP